MASFLPAKRGLLSQGPGPAYDVEALLNTDNVVWIAENDKNPQYSDAWLKDGRAVLICFPFQKLRENILAQIDRGSARGTVIAEILSLWDETVKNFPHLKKEHRIAVEWLTKTFTGSEMGV